MSPGVISAGSSPYSLASVASAARSSASPSPAAEDARQAAGSAPTARPAGGQAPSALLSSGTLSALLSGQMVGSDGPAGAAPEPAPPSASSASQALQPVGHAAVDAALQSLRSGKLTSYDAVSSLVFPGSAGAITSVSA